MLYMCIYIHLSIALACTVGPFENDLLTREIIIFKLVNSVSTGRLPC